MDYIVSTFIATAIIIGLFLDAHDKGKQDAVIAENQARIIALEKFSSVRIQQLEQELAKCMTKQKPISRD